MNLASITAFVTNNLKSYIKNNLILLSIIGVLLFYFIWTIIPSISNSLSSGVQVNPRPMIVKAVNEVSELTTAVFEMETVVPVSDRVMASTSQILYIAHGSVRVGIDLSDFGEDSVNIDETTKRITVVLPPLKILDSKLDVEHSETYSYHKGFVVGKNPIELIPEAQKMGIDKVESAACEPWLINLATERVEKTVSNLLSQNILTAKGYSIQVETLNSSQEICKRVPINHSNT